jgi:hypothetical protein
MKTKQHYFLFIYKKQEFVISFQKASLVHIRL